MMTKPNKKLLILIAVLIGPLLFLNSSSLVLALGTGGIGGYPANPDPNVPGSTSWFIYNLDLGESKDDAILVVNNSDETQTIKLYPVDSTTNNVGGFALEAENDPRDGVGAWIELAETIITLEPGANREIPFTIVIPQDADV